MEIAKLILEFIKALAWPIVTLILVLRFRSALSKILTGLSDRFRTADKLKLGVMGQEVELSGTAQVLLERKDELLRHADSESNANIEAARIQQSAQQLNNPMADIIGVTLFKAGSSGMTLEQVVKSVLTILSPKMKPESFVLIAMADQVEKSIDAMVSAGLAERRGDRIVLTERGFDIFSAVEKKQSTFLNRFRSLTN